MQEHSEGVYIARGEDVQSRTAADIEHLDRLARLLDSSVQVPFTRFRVGADSIVGLIPGVGDVAAGLVSSYILYHGWQLGASKRAMARMIGNVGLDLVVGAVPLLGDLFDATYKANLKNIRILKKDLSKLRNVTPRRRV